MTAVRVSLIGFLFFALSGSLIYAQDISVADGFYAYVPGIHVEVLRQESADTPGICQGQLAPIECEMAPSSGGLFGTWPPPLGTDAAGAVYYAVQAGNDVLDSGGTKIGIDGRTILRDTVNHSTEKLAVLMRQLCLGGDPCPIFKPTFAYQTPIFDVSNGRMVIEVHAENFSLNGTRTSNQVGLIAISGLPTMFDTLLTFTPGGNLSALVPGHPDGFRSADSLQVWTGALGTMPNWSLAQALECSASGASGQVVTVTDTLPDPVPGTGRYYLTASKSGADRRLGRQYMNGQYSARNPAGLPVCQ
jgi:hypothetical protein